MKKMILGLALVLLNTRALSAPAEIAKYFEGKNGCFLLQELESGKTLVEHNPTLCKERLDACSSFKVPIALMGFDSGVLKDENTFFKWDGVKRMLDGWNKDHTVRSWLKDSVVWVSQEITPKIGLPKIEKYLADFKYGNKDFSGGITKAWLSNSLKISAYEQADFLRRLKLGKLNVSKDAVSKTLSVIPAELDGKVHGKTGSGLSWFNPKEKELFRTGWYVGYYTVNGKEYVFAASTKTYDPGKKSVFMGPETKQIVLKILNEPSFVTHLN
jgi:beta-lactamase class D